MSAKEILLRAAAEVEANPKIWAKGCSAADINGERTEASGLDAVCWCAIGLIYRHKPVVSEAKQAIEFLKDAIPGPLRVVAIYNDTRITQPSELVSWFKKAAELCD